jgi:hypothetical protein
MSLMLMKKRSGGWWLPVVVEIYRLVLFVVDFSVILILTSAIALISCDDYLSSRSCYLEFNIQEPKFHVCVVVQVQWQCYPYL